MVEMSNPLRQQIEEMEPHRYARAAKRQATVAKKLANKKGIPVSARTQYLLDSTEDQLAAEQRERLDARQKSEPPEGPSGSKPSGALLVTPNPARLAKLKPAEPEL